MPEQDTPRVDWGKANCYGKEPDLFSPDTSDRNRLGRKALLEAREICNECPIKDPCLDYAISNDETGMWGGKTYAERKNIARARSSPRIRRLGGGALKDAR